MIATVAATLKGFLIPHAAHLRAQGWRVEAAAAGATADDASRVAFDRVHDLPLSRSLVDLPALVRGERAAARLIAQVDPDIVHVHTPIASFLVRAAVRRLPPERRPSVVYTAHGFHFFRGGRRVPNLVFLTAERVAGRWTDRLVVINDEDEAAARSHRIVRPDRLVRMPGIGLDTDRYAPTAPDLETEAAVRGRLGIPPAVPFFSIVGEFSPNKRQADGIAALARSRHVDARLVLLGDGPGRERLEGEARRLGVDRRVVFAGFVDDVRSIIRSSTALVLNSGREGLSRSVMEALALEVPVVASRARGNQELVGDSGSIVDVGDIDGVAAAMDWLIDHPLERREMGRRGRSRMVEGYDLRIVLRRYDELYRAMLGERVAGQPAGTESPGRASRR